MAPDLELWEGLVRLALAALLAGAIGIERELREQEAGLRTHMLVAVGATMFMLVGVYAWAEMPLGQNIGVVVDPSRVASYVVSGIGFLGAGAIIKHGINVRGLTTAASLWVVASIGVATGAGMYAYSLATTLLVIVALWPLNVVKRVIERKADEPRRLEVTLDRRASVVPVLASIEENEWGIASVELKEEGEVRRLSVVVTHAAEADLGGLLDDLGAREGVRTAELAD